MFVLSNPIVIKLGTVITRLSHAIFLHNPSLLYWWYYPSPSEGWERGGTPRRPNSLATPRGMDQRSKMKEVVPKMARQTTSRRLNVVVVVRSPPLSREVGRNGETTTPRGPTIRSPPSLFSLCNAEAFNLLWVLFSSTMYQGNPAV